MSFEPPKRIIFLDFDGVVVCLPVEYDRTLSGRKVHALNRGCVDRLNYLIIRTGAAVVVSSSWRLHEDLERLTTYLGRAGFLGRVVGVTPDLARLGDRLGVEVPADATPEEAHALYHPVQRGHEVEAWLQDHPEVESYVVLDDDSDRGPLPAHRWVNVRDGWVKGGLQNLHVDIAAAVLTLKREADQAAQAHGQALIRALEATPVGQSLRALQNREGMQERPAAPDYRTGGRGMTKAKTEREQAPCHFCQKLVDNLDCYCSGCKTVVCDDCDVSINWGGASGHGHPPELHRQAENPALPNEHDDEGNPEHEAEDVWPDDGEDDSQP